MIAVRLKEAIHARYRLEHRRTDNATRLRYLEKNPQAAMGGPHNFKAEMDGLKRQLADGDERYAALLP
jgi:hypothetical protein